MEELPELLETKERTAVCTRLIELLSSSQEPSIIRRLRPTELQLTLLANPNAHPYYY